ncbi:MAG TPA: hypothetical protein VMG38_00890 [Trebonia sp.]|nr:hypothetical protein [Trebonia sp.]
MRYQDAFGYADAFDADPPGGGRLASGGLGGNRYHSANSTSARHNDPRYSTGEQRPPWDFEDHGNPRDSRSGSFAPGRYPTGDFPTQTDGLRALGTQTRGRGFPAQSGGFPAQAGSFGAQATRLRAQTGSHRAQTGSFRAQTGGFRTGTGDFPTQADGIPAARPTIDGDYGVREDEQGWSAGRTLGGLVAGAVSGFLAAGTTLGVANLAAAFVRPRSSPIVAVGGEFMAHTPAAVTNFLAGKLGENDMATLLLSMYFAVALIALVIGMIAWRQLPAGVAGIGLFGLYGAFITYTAPGSHATDVIPSLAGSLAGIIVLAALTQWTRVRQRSAVTRNVVGPLGTERSGWAA